MQKGELASGVRLLVKAQALPDCAGGVTEVMREHWQPVRDELERLRGDRRLSVRERKVVENLLRW